MLAKPSVSFWTVSCCSLGPAGQSCALQRDSEENQCGREWKRPDFSQQQQQQQTRRPGSHGFRIPLDECALVFLSRGPLVLEVRS